MKIKLSKIDKKVLKVIKDIGRAVDVASLSAYVVGGFVRDVILDRKNLDIDIVIEGDAIKFARTFARKKKAKVTVYKDFGTATLEYKDGLRVDLATARKESYSRSGALPKVRPGSIEDDLFRRDFTINAMAFMLNKQNFGECVDPFGGMDDIKKGKILVLHEQSFVDDPTRILRAVRFEQRFDFSIARPSIILLKTALDKGVVNNVKPPRYFAEFRKVLQEPYPRKCIERLQKLGGLEFLGKNFSPRYQILNIVEQNIKKLRKDSFYKDKEWNLIYLMSLVEGITARDIEDIAAKFCLTKVEKINLLSVRTAMNNIICLNKSNLPSSQIYRILNPLSLETIYFIRARTSVNIIGLYVDKFLKKLRFVKLAVTGKDLKQLGVGSGKKIGVILDILLRNKLNGKLRTKKQELREAKKIIASL